VSDLYERLLAVEPPVLGSDAQETSTAVRGRQHGVLGLHRTTLRSGSDQFGLTGEE